MLARNLVDIAVRVAREDDGVVLEVQDSGPGLADADLARLGERFFRVPGGDESGSGLGWSIVRRIAAAHAATVTARRAPALGGLAVLVRFPGP